jgi:hypothetical protein
MSIPTSSPKIRSAISFSVREGALTLNARKIDALVVADLAAADYFAADRDPVGLDRAHLHRAVGQEDSVAGLHIFGEAGVAGGCPVRIAQHRLYRDRECRAGFQIAAPVCEFLQADFRTLQIEQHAGMFSEFFRRLARRVYPLGVFLLRAMRRVQAEDVDTRFKEPVKHAWRIAGRPQRRHYFGIWHKRVILTILTSWTSIK